MIVDLGETSTRAVSARIDAMRADGGALTLSRVLTLVIAADAADAAEAAIDAATAASHEHPCRIIAVSPGDRDSGESRLRAQLRVGADAGAGEIVALRLDGPLADHAASVVTPFLLPDTPVVAWWPGEAPAHPAEHPLGRLAVRRITDATDASDPRAAIAGRLATYTPGDTDLAWSRITSWRALLTAALDQPPYEPVTSATVSGLAGEPALDILAGWLAARIDGPVTRRTGDLVVELHRRTETVTLRRPQEGLTATLSRTARPDALVPLARREARDCLAEDLRRLDPDEIYEEALNGLQKVAYP